MMSSLSLGPVDLWSAARARPLAALLFVAATAASIALGVSTAMQSRELLPLLLSVLVIPGLVLMERSVGIMQLSRQTVSSVWFVSYLVMLWLPSFLVYRDYPGDARNPYLISVASALVTVPLGIWIVNWRTRFTKSERDAYFTRPIDHDVASDAMFIVAATITAAIVGSVVLYFAMLRENPILYMLRYPGCDLVLGQLREEAFKFFDPRYAQTGTLLFYLFLPLRTIVDPFMLVALFGFWWVTRRRRWLVLFLVILAVAEIYAAVSLARAPAAALVVRMAVLFYVLRAGRFGIRSIVVWLVAIAAFPVFVTALAYSPGPPPADCGPAADRGPAIGRTALIDPLALTGFASVAARGAPTDTSLVTTGDSTSVAARGAPTDTSLVTAGDSTGESENPVAASSTQRAAGAITQVLRRLSYTEAWALYLYYPVFPDQHDFLYGQTLLKPFLRFVGADFYVENYVYQKAFPTSPIPSGHLNGAFQSNLYADFGLPGVVVGGVAIGAIMQGIQVFVWRRRKSILWIATFSILVYAFWVLHSGSITSVLITNGAGLILLVPPMMLLAAHLLERWNPLLRRSDHPVTDQ